MTGETRSRVQRKLSGLIGTARHPHMQKIRITGLFFKNGLHWQFEVRLLLFIIYLFTAIGLLPVGSGYFTCKQNTKLVITRFKSGGLNEKHVVATWNLGNHLSICFYEQ